MLFIRDFRVKEYKNRFGTSVDLCCDMFLNVIQIVDCTSGRGGSSCIKSIDRL